MLRTPGLLAVIRRNLLQRDEPLDPFGPLDDPFPPRRQPVQPLSLVGPVGPRAANRRDDVSRVALILERAGFAEPGAAAGDVFDSRLEDGIRRFQRRHGLAVDGLLNPGGPTERTINRALEALASPPAPLSALTGEALSANTRLVRHLMATTEDGLVPDLLASDFRSDAAGRAKSVDLFAQLFLRDPARARDLREKAGTQLSADDAGLLDRLILAARRAEVERPTPEKPSEPDDPEGPGDPDNPPGDPGKPDEPEKPDKPSDEMCRRWESELRAQQKNLSEIAKEIEDKKLEAQEAEKELEQAQAELDAERAKAAAALSSDALKAARGVIGAIIAGISTGTTASAVIAALTKRNQAATTVDALTAQIEFLERRKAEIESRIDELEGLLRDC